MSAPLASVSPPAAPDRQGLGHARAVTLVSLASALGLFFGYTRDAGLAFVFGASGATDAFFVATLIPIMLGRVVLSGALPPAMLPIFVGMLERGRPAWELVNTVLTISVLALAMVLLGLALGATPIVAWLAPGFDSERAALATRMLVMTAPAVAFFGLSAVLGVLLNAFGIYDLPALGLVLVNGISFAAVIFTAATWGVESVALGLVLGGLLQLIVVAIALRRQGWTYRPKLDWRQSEVRELFRLFLPMLAFMLVDQVVAITERVIASGFSTGQLSRLTYAGKIYQIPIMIVASSVAVVLFPILSKQNETDDLRRYSGTMSSGIRNVILLSTPLTIWLFFASSTWVRLVFQRGEFTAFDTRGTAELLRWYSLAVLPTGILVFVTRGLHALRDMVTPLIIGLIEAVVYVLAAIVLSQQFEAVGLVFAFVITQPLAALLSLIVLQRRLSNRQTPLGSDGVLKVLGAGVAMIGVGIVWLLIVEPMIANLSLPIQASALILALLVSSAAYFACASVMGVPEARTYLSLFSLKEIRLALPHTDARV